MEAKLKEWGNSTGIILPSRKLQELGLKKGDTIEIEIIAKKRINAFGIAKGAKPFVKEKDGHNKFW